MIPTGSEAIGAAGMGNTRLWSGTQIGPADLNFSKRFIMTALGLHGVAGL